MVRPITKTVSVEIPDEEIDKAMDELRAAIREKAELRAFERLMFIRMRREGVEMGKAMRIAGISKPTAYEWQDNWNESGLDSVRPNFAGGAPRRLDDDQLELLREELRTRGSMSTPEIQSFIEEEFDVTYTRKQVAVRMRNLGAHYAKPYPRDYRSPDDADAVLKKLRPGAGVSEQEGEAPRRHRIPGRVHEGGP